jgi:chromosome segregation ATPase
LPRIDEIAEKVEKFEDKIKLLNLLAEKKFADLELKIGQLSEKLNEITVEFPKLKEKSSEIEDLLNVVNLGLVDYKEKFEEIETKVSEFTQLPEVVSNIRLNLENKMKDINENFKAISANLEVLNNLKDEILKSTEETISPKMEELEKNIQQNKAEIEHLKSSIDGFSLALKSFEKTIELTNIDEIIRRFDSLDRRMINLENELEKFRYLIPDLSMTVGDVEILKKKLKELSSAVMDALSRMNEFEININRKLAFFEDLTKKAEKIEIKAPSEEKSTVTEIPSDYRDRMKELEEEMKKTKELPFEIKKEIEELRERMNRIENKSVEAFPPDVEELKNRVEELRKYVQDMEKLFSSYKIEQPKFVKEKGIPKNLVDEINSLREIISRISSENEGFKKVIRDLRINQMQMITSDVFVEFVAKLNSMEKKLAEIEKDLSKVRKTKPFVLE